MQEIKHIGYAFVKRLIRDLSPVNLWQIREVVFCMMLKAKLGDDFRIFKLFGDPHAILSNFSYSDDKISEIIAKIEKACNMLKDEVMSNSDVFGDVYEYMLAYYTGDGGSAGGEFYTPQEVSELLAEIAVVGKEEVNSVYDPTCGSGSRLS